MHFGKNKWVLWPLLIFFFEAVRLLGFELVVYTKVKNNTVLYNNILLF